MAKKLNDDPGLVEPQQIEGDLGELIVANSAVHLNLNLLIHVRKALFEGHTLFTEGLTYLTVEAEATSCQGDMALDGVMGDITIV